MGKLYRVTLTHVEQEFLRSLIASHKGTSSKVKRAYILLAADENGELRWRDAEISKAYKCSISTIERLRAQFVLEGLESSLEEKPRRNHREKLFTGDVEAHLIALRCSTPPEGHSYWTLELLADKMVALNYVPHMSYESVRQILKKMNLSLGR
jgi:transposase